MVRTMEAIAPPPDVASTPRRLVRARQAWADLALVLPLFVAYHLGVVLLDVRNAADPLTAELLRLAEHHLFMYWLWTLGLGLGLVLVFSALAGRAAFEPRRFFSLAIEAVVYALLMRAAAAAALGYLSLAAEAEGPGLTVGRPDAVAAGIVMSLGAGFYEELVFRVGLVGGGLIAMKLFFGTLPRLALGVGWVLITALVFAGWHYVGPLADAYHLQSFVFRAVCGLVLTVIFLVRGFAAAVWTHALYDIWALALVEL
ncbi:MAG: CPBP family intramembrane glutamic endopeptidase [Myxococcota bacterium]